MDGLITTSLLDMPDMDKGSSAQTIFDTGSSSLNKASLTWDSCCTFLSDNTSAMVEKYKSPLKLIQVAQSESTQKIFHVGHKGRSRVMLLLQLL